MFRLFFLFSFFFSFFSPANSIKGKDKTTLVRIFTSYPVSSFEFSIVSGKYILYSPEDTLAKIPLRKIFSFEKEDALVVSIDGDSLNVFSKKFSGKYRSLRFVPENTSGSFKIKSLKPAYKERVYDDELQVSVLFGNLLLVNKPEIEKYVAGVVHWEVGTKNPQEFNKVKAIACRTYAFGNWRRHEGEGFQLCDEVHCQVYKSKSFNAAIHQAAQETAEYILVDDSVKIVTAAFHSNCGGQTMNSEDVWSKKTSSLRSVRDTFCLRKTNANWEKRFPKDLWMDYLQAKYAYPVYDSVYASRVLNFSQPVRSVFLVEDGFFIPLKSIREDLKLKSTFFEISAEDGMVVFKGRGFGHGVGLCQEGAMNMAKQGFSYTKILNHYYTGVHLVRYSQLDFFKSE